MGACLLSPVVLATLAREAGVRFGQRGVTGGAQPVAALILGSAEPLHDLAALRSRSGRRSLRCRAPQRNRCRTADLPEMPVRQMMGYV